MAKEMVISASPHETRVAILEEGQLCEFYVEREKEFALVGSIYKGRVTRVLPGMQSAFVEIGLDSDAFLYVTDFLEEVEELEHIVTTVEEKVEKMEEQGGPVFAANGATTAPAEPADVEPAGSQGDFGGSGRPSEGAPAEEYDGNTQAAAAAATPHAPAAHPPAYNASVPDRGRYENRGGAGHGGSGGHGGRGGRGGRGGGRDFGRGGRRGRQGRHGGGERRFGRELPSSKYASPRPYEDSPSEPSTGSGYTPVILPGESLAKYRDRPSGSTGGAAPSTAEVGGEQSQPLEPSAAVVPPIEKSEPAAPEASSVRASSFTRAGAARAGFAGTGLEPLPGESISKWQKPERESGEHAEWGGLPVMEEPAEHPSLAPEIEMEEMEEAKGHHSEEGSDLSEDEASAVAEHVADIQIEEAEREHEEHDFSAGEDEALEADAPEGESEEDETASAGHIEDHTEGDSEDHGVVYEAGAGESPETAQHEEPSDPAAVDADAVGNREPLASAGPSQERQPWKARVGDDFRSRMQHPGRRGRDRGRRGDRRPQHGHGRGGHGAHRPQARRPQLIADLLKQGQEIIVQIAKEPLGKKGARITSHVALPGRYLVYMPTLDHTGVSRKIASADDRARLRHLVNEAKGSAGGGFIVRTAAASAAPEEVRADVEFLTRTWSEIKARSEQRKAPSLLHRDLNLVERILRDYMSSEFTAIWVDSEEEYTKVVDFMSRFQPKLVDRVKLYTKATPVFEEFGIQQEIDKGLRPKVWLKSGGYIVINHTEALVAIDVNTGKFVGKGSNRLEDTIVRTNLEAVKEIVRQMRLRDLGGIIVIDFIDMEERRNREKVMAALEDALRVDRAPSKVLRFNEFGLVAITRKRTKQALERTLCQPCPYCSGSGMVKSVPTLCYEIQSEARKMAPEMDSGSVTLRVHPEISKALKTREAGLIDELERWTKKSIIIQADPTLHWEQYDIY
ncbi:MAG TPA: Rne/Rng family ribonuclease [Candidatus Acidoferrales bacterium]|nr:Rne/Rng family ribonuclease [Candidatus Acidoferrales bacterium]